jgi:hypothetical protein
MAGRTAKGLREHNARQAKLAALRQAEQRRQNRIRLTIGAIGVVIAVVVALVAVGLTRGARPSGPAGATQASARVVKQLGSIPTAVYDAAGAPAKSPALPLNGVPTLTSDGKPEVLYIGAEYCPYCAAERWSVVAALSRFGTFSGLGQTQSSSVDYYPNTPTLSFEGAKYSSDYVAFQGYETEDRQRQPLDSLPPSVSRLFNKSTLTIAVKWPLTCENVGHDGAGMARNCRSFPHRSPRP